MIGRHKKRCIKINELEKKIQRRNEEIRDIKSSLIIVLESIIKTNESNNYGQPDVKKAKISQICRDTIYQLFMDESTDKKIK